MFILLSQYNYYTSSSQVAHPEQIWNNLVTYEVLSPMGTDTPMQMFQEK